MKIKLYLALIALATISFAFIKKATNFVVDPAKSKLTWTAKKVTGAHTGNINLSSGVLNVEGTELKSGTFEIDTKTITNNDLDDESSRNKLLNHLKSDDFFGVEKYPTAKLDITSAVSKGSNTYDVKGNLTIKGITNPIEFPATVTVSGNTLNATAKITVDRTKYGIKYRSSNFFEGLGDKVIYDNFDLDVNIVATQK
jgi:polyisoprenoid-binding protein YceI